jgi:hypothetical protein
LRSYWICGFTFQYCEEDKKQAAILERATADANLRETSFFGKDTRQAVILERARATFFHELCKNASIF